MWELSAVNAILLSCFLILAAAQEPGTESSAGSVEMEGLIEPSRTINISPSVDGLIEEVLVERGDQVEEGQVLARLESSVERAQEALAKERSEMVAALQKAEARLKLSKQKLEKDSELFESKIISSDEFEERNTEHELATLVVLEAQESLALARLEHRRASAALALRTVKSPVKGVVVDRMMSPGELVNRTGQVIILELAQIDPLHVEVIASVDLLGKIEVGSTAEVLPQPPVGGVYPATVTVVDRVVDAASGTFGIRLEVSNADYQLPAGLKCVVRFPRNSAE